MTAIARHALVAAALAAAAASPRAAQPHRTRLLQSWYETVKVGSADEARHVEIVFDYTDVVARRHVFDAGGRLLETVALPMPPQPSPDEIEEARALMMEDPEIAAIVQRTGAALESGFLVSRPDGPCGPGSRCVEVQLLAPSRWGIIRRVAVDLVARQVAIPVYVVGPNEEQPGVVPEGAPAAPRPEAGAGTSQPSTLLCSLPDHTIAWPASKPVWQMCWRRAVDSTGFNGSGLELHDVTYKGRSVLKQAHMPVLNVQYSAGGCGCYRDWADQEVRFQADNVIFPGYAEPTTPPLTVCDTGGSGGDVGSFYGVAAEKVPELILTTQFMAGWYRYTMKWIFQDDGVIRTTFGFAAVSAGCVSYTHVHHCYWRLDFDLDGRSGDRMFYGLPPMTHPAPVITERNFVKQPGCYWEVRDGTSGLGYRIDPGAADGDVDSFGVADAWVLRYHGNEIDDAGLPGSNCPIRINGLLTSESVDNTDVVFWYGAHAHHQGGQLDDCHVVGPTFTPIGPW